MGELITMTEEALMELEASLPEAQIIPDIDLINVSNPSELARLLSIEN